MSNERVQVICTSICHDRRCWQNITRAKPTGDRIVYKSLKYTEECPLEREKEDKPWTGRG